MKTTSAGVLTILTMAGCSRPASIEPRERTSGYLILVPDGGGYAVAEMLVPAGYEKEQFAGSDFTFRRHHGDPTIHISYTDVSALEPVCAEWPSNIGYEPRLARSEARRDGDLVVCDTLWKADHRIGWTDVVRAIRWRHFVVYCDVSFPRTDDPKATRAESRPSDSRVEDAIAICDSLALHDMTRSEHDRFFPGERYYPDTPSKYDRTVPDPTTAPAAALSGPAQGAGSR